MSDMSPLGMASIVIGSILKTGSILPLVGNPDGDAQVVWQSSGRACDLLLTRARPGAHPGDRWFMGFPGSLAGSSMGFDPEASIITVWFGGARHNARCVLCPSENGQQPLHAMIVMKRLNGAGVREITVSYLLGHPSGLAVPETYQLLSVACGQVFCESLTTRCTIEQLLSCEWSYAPIVWGAPEARGGPISRIAAIPTQLLAHVAGKGL